MKLRGHPNPLCPLPVLICRCNETKIPFDYHRIKKSLCKPIKCNRAPALHRRAAMACVAPSRRRHGNSVSGHATECLSVSFSRVSFHLWCGSHRDTLKVGSFKVSEKGKKRGREWDKEKREKTDETRAALPTGTEAELRNWGIVFPVSEWSGVQRRGRWQGGELID